MASGRARWYTGKNALFIIMATLFALLLSNSSDAKQGHIKLLAVTDMQDGSMQGSVADLYLEIRPGNGGVYIDTFPLTRIDTQISTRFAKEYACKEVGIDCSRNDFFYTIKAESTLVGGPSAGSAIAVLTLAMLNNWELNQDMAITGTINSGGLIGPVGGLREKIDAAAGSGIKAILIPAGEKLLDGENFTIDIDEYAKQKNVRIIEAGDAREAVYHFTGERIEEPEGNVSINPEYINMMKEIAKDLCSRTEELQKSIFINENLKAIDILNLTNDSYISLQNMTINAKVSIADGKYYSAASQCFGANTRYAYIQMLIQNLSTAEIMERIKFERKKAILLDNKTESKRYRTVADLETYMIVKERLIEASDILNSAILAVGRNDTANAIYQSAFAIERINSAESWSRFFNLESKEFQIDKASLKNSCISKIAEAEERYQYVTLFLPDALGDTRKTINRAYRDLNNESFELCLFKASKAKAEADTLLGMFGVEQPNLDSVIDRKIEAVRKNLLRQQAKGFFPIIGYSYCEYATTLNSYDKFSSLLYAEYSLELSNLDIYFRQDSTPFVQKENFDIRFLWVFLFGASFGALVMVLVIRRGKNKRTKSGRRRLN